MVPPRPSSLVADGYRFVARYLSNDTTGKNLSLGEAQALEAAGLDIVSNWEDGARTPSTATTRGSPTRRTRRRVTATADGAPATRPIYFSIDFDAESAQAAAVNAYFQGVASDAIGLARTGAYGGYFIINQLFNAGLITVRGWRTYTWSGTAQARDGTLARSFAGYENGIAGGEMDLDEAVATDFGRWDRGSRPSAGVHEPVHGLAARRHRRGADGGRILDRRRRGARLPERQRAVLRRPPG